MSCGIRTTSFLQTHAVGSAGSEVPARRVGTFTDERKKRMSRAKVSAVVVQPWPGLRLSDTEVTHAARVLQVIAQTTRLRILSEVARSEPPGPSCEDLRRMLKLNSSAVVPGHVDALEEVGLVVSKHRPDRWKRTVQLRDPAAVAELLRAAAKIRT